jgi:hypothetical protein
MELQAVRYAAMVSKMAIEQALDTYQQHTKDVDAFDARSHMLDFLGWDAPSEEHFGQDVRILLFSEDYSRELTSSVPWLNEKGLDITAFRVSAYTLGTQILIDFSRSSRSRKRRTTRSRSGTSRRWSRSRGAPDSPGTTSTTPTTRAPSAQGVKP